MTYGKRTSKVRRDQQNSSAHLVQRKDNSKSQRALYNDESEHDEQKEEESDSVKENELDECSEVYSDLQDLEQASKPFACQFPGCKKRFTRKTRMRTHMHIHNGNQPFRCSVTGCGKLFSERQNLKSHMRIHRNERPFMCSYGCGLSFRTKGNLKDHERRHTGDR